MNYGLFFSAVSGASLTAIRIPVNPECYKMKYPGEHERYNVLGLGEIIHARTPGLFEISWEGVFPGSADHPGVATRGQFEKPKFYIDKFLEYQKSRAPIHFSAIRTMEDGSPIFDTEATVLVTDFEIEEKGGETGDFYYSLTIVEHRDYQVEVATVLKPAETPLAAAEVAVEPQRPIPSGQLYVTCPVTINGRYYADSYGGGAHGTASNRRGFVSKIVTTDPKRPFPIHVKSEAGGALGWLTAKQLQVIT